jgi:hypothetical protein
MEIDEMDETMKWRAAPAWHSLSSAKRGEPNNHQSPMFNGK